MFALRSIQRFFACFVSDANFIRKFHLVAVLLDYGGGDCVRDFRP